MPRYRTPVDLAGSVAQIRKKPPAPSLRTRAEARRGTRANSTHRPDHPLPPGARLEAGGVTEIERTSADNEVIKVDGELWVRALSARYGRCSLTGNPVRIGDRVYIPQNAGHHPRQRILARVVEERLGS